MRVLFALELTFIAGCTPNDLETLQRTSAALSVARERSFVSATLSADIPHGGQQYALSMSFVGNDGLAVWADNRSDPSVRLTTVGNSYSASNGSSGHPFLAATSLSTENDVPWSLVRWNSPAGARWLGPTLGGQLISFFTDGGISQTVYPALGNRLVVATSGAHVLVVGIEGLSDGGSALQGAILEPDSGTRLNRMLAQTALPPGDFFDLSTGAVATAAGNDAGFFVAWLDGRAGGSRATAGLFGRQLDFSLNAMQPEVALYTSPYAAGPPRSHSDGRRVAIAFAEETDAGPNRTLVWVRRGLDSPLMRALPPASGGRVVTAIPQLSVGDSVAVATIEQTAPTDSSATFTVLDSTLTPVRPPSVPVREFLEASTLGLAVAGNGRFVMGWSRWNAVAFGNAAIETQLYESNGAAIGVPSFLSLAPEPQLAAAVSADWLQFRTMRGSTFTRVDGTLDGGLDFGESDPGFSTLAGRRGQPALWVIGDRPLRAEIRAPDGRRLGQGIFDSVPSGELVASINTDGWDVVWVAGRTLRHSRVFLDAGVTPSSPIVTRGNDVWEPSFAVNNSGQRLVFWSERDLGRVAYRSLPSGPVGTLASDYFSAPRLRALGDVFVLVWVEGTVTQVAWVTGAGQIIRQMAVGSAIDDEPGLACGVQECVVVWTHGTGGIWSIEGRAVFPDAGTSARTPLVRSASSVLNPHIAWVDRSQYVLAYDRFEPTLGHRRTYASELEASGLGGETSTDAGFDAGTTDGGEATGPLPDSGQADGGSTVGDEQRDAGSIDDGGLAPDFGGNGPLRPPDARVACDCSTLDAHVLVAGLAALALRRRSVNRTAPERKSRRGR
jgi:hypothetical protein